MKTDNIIFNPNEAWEQVLYFLKKKDIALEKRKEIFFDKIILYLEKAFLKETYLKELEIPMKKNENNTNYDIIKLTKEDIFIGVEEVYDEEGLPVLDEDNNVVTKDKFEEQVIWFISNEKVDKEYLKEYFDINTIIVFETNLLTVFEKLHLDKNKQLSSIDKVQNYLKEELNVRKLI